MTKKFFIFLVFAFLLSPSNIFACETKSNACCCKMEKNATSKKNCCKKVTNTNKENKSCNGKCGHSGCNIATIQLVVIVPSVIEIPFTSFYAFGKKVKFYDFKTNISSGFNSIWLPPVIG